MVYRGGSRNSTGGGGDSGSSKRQVRRNFQTDKQKRTLIGIYPETPWIRHWFSLQGSNGAHLKFPSFDFVYN